MLVKDGHGTIVSLADGVVLHEKAVTPPGMDIGEKVDTTGMRNQVVRTAVPGQLIETTPGQMTCAYDPAFLVTAQSQLGVNQEITVTFPDGEVYTFWGWLRSFKPNEVKGNEQPTAECIFESGNEDDTGAETVPTIT